LRNFWLFSLKVRHCGSAALLKAWRFGSSYNITFVLTIIHCFTDIFIFVINEILAIGIKLTCELASLYGRNSFQVFYKWAFKPTISICEKLEKGKIFSQNVPTTDYFKQELVIDLMCTRIIWCVQGVQDHFLCKEMATTLKQHQAKMLLVTVQFFILFANKQLKMQTTFRKLEKMYSCQMHFGLTNIASEVHRFRVTIIF